MITCCLGGCLTARPILPYWISHQSRWVHCTIQISRGRGQSVIFGHFERMRWNEPSQMTGAFEIFVSKIDIIYIYIRIYTYILMQIWHDMTSCTGSWLIIFIQIYQNRREICAFCASSTLDLLYPMWNDWDFSLPGFTNSRTSMPSKHRRGTF